MAVITAKAVTGNFSVGTNWVGDVAPTIADSFVIPSGATITVDVDTTSAGGTVESLTDGGLVLAANLTLTGVLTVGNGESKDGCLTLGAGTTLTTSANIVLNNCRLRTTATSGSWAKVVLNSGAGVLMGTVYSSPKQDIDLSYVSFVGSSGSTLAMSGRSDRGGAALTNQLNMPHCAFDGIGTIAFGITGTDMDKTCPKVLDYCDFRNVSTLRFYDGTTAQTGVARTAKNITVTGPSSSSLCTLRFDAYAASAVYDFSGSVFYNVMLGTSAQTGVHNFSNTMWYGASGLADGSIQINAKGYDFSGAYVFREESSINPHPVNVASLPSEKSDHFDGAVFEVYGSEPNQIIVSASTYGVTFTNILDIGNGDICNVVGGSTAPHVNVSHCTRFIRSDVSDVASLFLSESSVYTGDVSVESCIVSAAVQNGRGMRVAGSYTQNIATYDYNCHNNITSILNNESLFTFTNTPYLNDVDVDPQFVDTSRRLRTWAESEGLPATDAAAIGYLLSINGYDSTTKTQSATPADGSVADAVAWVRAGYAPTNSALLNAGHDGVTIGALEYVSADETAPVLTSASATATSATTATVSVTTDDGNGTLYFLASANATEEKATVKAALSQAVTTSGEQTVNVEGLDPSTTYYPHFVQTNGAGLDSAEVVTGAAFTTPEYVDYGDPVAFDGEFSDVTLAQLGNAAVILRVWRVS